MTVPEAKQAVRTWWVPAAIVVLGAVIGVNYMLLIPALGKQARQAREGQNARTTQCRTFPIAIKLYTAAARYQLITADDLQTYLSAAPKGCPPVSE